MSTQQPAYYRDLLRRISLLENAGDLPQWFREAWSNNRVNIWDAHPKAVNYDCIIPVNSKLYRHARIQFKVEEYLEHVNGKLIDSYRVKFDPINIYLTPQARTQNQNYFVPQILDVLSKMLSLPLEPKNLLRADVKHDLFLQVCIDSKVITQSLDNNAEQLYHLGKQEIENDYT